MTAPHTKCQPGTSEAPTPDDFAALREIEVAWLSAELSRAIKNLAYPVGMGIAPQSYHMESAATKLFDRYAKMIEMAHATRDTTLQAHIEKLTKALEAAREEIVMAIAFIGRDLFTDRINATADSLHTRLCKADADARLALSVPLERSGGAT